MAKGHIRDASDAQLREIYELLDSDIVLMEVDWDWILLWAEGKAEHPVSVAKLIEILKDVKEGKFYK